MTKIFAKIEKAFLEMRLNIHEIGWFTSFTCWRRMIIKIFVHCFRKLSFSFYEITSKWNPTLSKLHDVETISFWNCITRKLHHIKTMLYQPTSYSNYIIKTTIYWKNIWKLFVFKLICKLHQNFIVSKLHQNYTISNYT